MDRWRNRVALVTGASSGIGAAICHLLAANGLKVVAAARSKDTLDSLFSSLSNVFTFKVDITNDDELRALFKWIESNEALGKLDICIANAGRANDKGMLEEDPGVWRSVVNLNMVSTALCGQLAVKSFLSHKVDDGNLIFINSLSGHRVAFGNPWYTATKFGLTAIIEGFRRELRTLNGGDNYIRVGQVSPGLVRTKFQATKANVAKEDTDEYYDSLPSLEASDVADMVLNVLKAPKHVQVHDIQCRPLKQAD